MNVFLSIEVGTSSFLGVINVFLGCPDLGAQKETYLADWTPPLPDTTSEGTAKK